MGRIIRKSDLLSRFVGHHASEAQGREPTCRIRRKSSPDNPAQQPTSLYYFFGSKQTKLVLLYYIIIYIVI